MTPQAAIQVALFLSDLSDSVYLDEYRIAQALDAEPDETTWVRCLTCGLEISHAARLACGRCAS